MWLESIVITIIRYYRGVQWTPEQIELLAEAGRKCETESGLTQLPTAGE